MSDAPPFLLYSFRESSIMTEKFNPVEKYPFPTDSALRKEMPMAEGFLDYFPHACLYVSRISYLGNEKHNPGEKLHWARGKSMDQDDCIIRHTAERGTFDPDDGCLHDGKRAWRAMAALQLELERRMEAGLPIFDEDVIAANRAKQKERLAAKAMTNIVIGHASDFPTETPFKRPSTGALPPKERRHESQG